MADIGSLVVKLAAETSEFQADMGRSARILNGHVGDMTRSLGSLATVAKTSFAMVVGGISVGALRDFVSKTLNASAALQQLSESTGASTTALSGLAPVATISGTALETIGTNLAKLSKGLAGIDDEGADATRALQFLGISAKDATGSLRDPAVVLNDVALKLAEFQDGAGKTALAMDLFGKSGAMMLPFLKDLAENQDLNIRLTAKQIEEADAAAKAFGRMKAETDFVAQAFVTSAIPAMSVLAEEMKKIFLGTGNVVEGVQRLRDDGTLVRWAESSAYAVAVLVDSLRVVAQGIRSIAGSFTSVWADIELAGTFLAGGTGLNPFSEENRARLKAALDKRNALVEEANKNYVELWNMPLIADAVTKRFAEIRANAERTTDGATPRGALEYSAAGSASANAGMEAIERGVRRLKESIDEESGILQDRQRMIDLHESLGYLTFKEGSEARLAAQHEFTRQLNTLVAEEERVLLRGLATVARTTQEKNRLLDMMGEATRRRLKFAHEAQQSSLEREVRSPGAAFKNALDEINQRATALRASADEEAAIMRGRQRVIDLYEEQGYLRFKEARDLRANAQADYVERAGWHFDEEEGLLRRALESFAKTADQRKQIEDRLTNIALKRQQMEREAAQATLDRTIRSPFEALRDIQQQAERSESEFKTREEQVKLLRESGAISELESLRRLTAAREESGKQLASLAAQARAVAEAAPGNERFADSMRQIEEAARQAAASAKELGQRAKEITEPFTAGFQKGLKTFLEGAETTGKQIESLTVRAFNGMTDAIIELVMTGKTNFRSLANSIISDLIRIQIQQSITKPLGNWLGSLWAPAGEPAPAGVVLGGPAFAAGGVMTAGGPMPLRRYAGGGIANSPQLAMFGEGSQPEAYVPLPDGRSIPVTMSGSGTGDVFNISVSVADAGASVSGDDAGGRNLGRAIASAVRQEMLAQKRAGGLLDSRRDA